jgi:hypothetical protein
MRKGVLLETRRSAVQGKDKIYPQGSGTKYLFFLEGLNLLSFVSSRKY